ncbi:MAG: GNAT family N-acetyltransferase [Desulfobacula sp.]|nr:GNAT family N-acetyltransferase [Desulfobacula sp.]
MEIGIVHSSEEKELQTFLEKNLNNWMRFISLWRWRQTNYSISGEETAAIAKEKTEVVGCVGIVPASVTFKGSRIRTSWQQDSLVLKTMRGKGVGKKLVIDAAKGWDLVLAKGTSNAMYGLRKFLGYIDVPNSNYLLIVCRPRPLLKRVREGLLEYFLYLWKIIFLAPKTSFLIKIKEIYTFDKTFNILAEKLSKVNELKIYKDSAYLNWRYFQCPGKKYTVFKAYDAENMAAIVLNITGKQSDEGWIVDMICHNENKDGAFVLLKKALGFFADQGVFRIWVFTTMPSVRKWFYRFGFVPTGKTPHFTFLRGENGFNQLKFEKINWNFWHGDGDIELYQ